MDEEKVFRAGYVMGSWLFGVATGLGASLLAASTHSTMTAIGVIAFASVLCFSGAWLARTIHILLAIAGSAIFLVINVLLAKP